MTAATIPTAEHLVELARLTRIEYERRVLLQLCWDTLDDLPDGEQDEDDQTWADQTYTAWATAWEQLEAHRTGQAMAIMCRFRITATELNARIADPNRQPYLPFRTGQEA